MTLLIQAANVGYAHGGNTVFEDISFEIREGDRLALIGENGAGKSTLFRLMARELKPHSGVVTHRSNLTIGYLSQHSHLRRRHDDARGARAGGRRSRRAGGATARARSSRCPSRSTTTPWRGARQLRRDAGAARSDRRPRRGRTHRAHAGRSGCAGSSLGPAHRQLSGGEKKLVALAALRWPNRMSSCSTNRTITSMPAPKSGWRNTSPASRRGGAHLARPLHHRQCRQPHLRDRRRQDQGYQGNYSKFQSREARSAGARRTALRTARARVEEAQG